LDTIADEIRADLAAGDAGYRAAGEKFTAQKAALPHGQWLPWLHANGFKERTAQSYMAYAKSASGCGYADWLQATAVVTEPRRRDRRVLKPLGKSVWRNAITGIEIGLKYIRALPPLTALQRDKLSEIRERINDMIKQPRPPTKGKKRKKRNKKRNKKRK
jgi:hypothetical protein